MNYEFIETIKNKSTTIEASGFVVDQYLGYVYEEYKKGKIPLIIVGAGISASNVEIRDGGKPIKNGLPVLLEMIEKIFNLVMDKRITKLQKSFFYLTILMR